MANVLLGTKAVGDIVKLKVNGILWDFIVVHQGLPSSMYDESCDGTWLLMKAIYEQRQWHSSDLNDYANSDVHKYLNGAFLNLFDADIQTQIKQVRIPYRPGSGDSKTINSGANGLIAKIFPLSDVEVGGETHWSNVPLDGVMLDYFEYGNSTSAKEKRIADLDGPSAGWWTRSPCNDNYGTAYYIGSNGNTHVANSCSSTSGVRPALILPSNLLVSDDGTVTAETVPFTLGIKAIGSIVKLKRNGALTNYIVVQHGKPSAAYDDSFNDGTWLLEEECPEKRQWHSSNVNDYANSDTHKYLNGPFLGLFDANIQAVIKQVKIPYRAGSGYGKTVTSGSGGLSAKIFLLSSTEVNLVHGNEPTNEGACLSYFSGTVQNGSDRKRAATLNGSWVSWLLRSPYSNSNYGATFALHVLANGGWGSDYCTNSDFAIRPALVLPSDLLVLDDGTVYVNTAPTTPDSITVPETVNGGTNITVSWTAASDVDGNLEGYIVERSTDGGSSWTQIYQGSGLSTDTPVAFGAISVMYRVKAYDTEGLSSSWRTSPQRTVINNRAPTAPGAISVPENVFGGGVLTVSWTGSTDADGDPVSYALERQVDGGSWAEIFRGEVLTYTDSITRGWQSVAYRVRAYDSGGAYSGCTASETRTVDNNFAPVITGEPESGTELGESSEAFSVSYNVTDADGDTVTVREYLDDRLQRSFTATLGQENTFQAVDPDHWQTVLNGPHTLKVVANDGKVDSAPYTLTFTKAVHAASVTLAAPMEADAEITVCALSVTGSIPADAVFRVEVTNNALDDAPVWEDCTAEVRLGANHPFENQTAAGGFAFNFRVTVERGASGQGGYITSIQGGFQ